MDDGLGLHQINMSNPDYKIDVQSGKLVLVNTDYRHFGVYQCRAENIHGTVLSNTAFMQFACKYP